MNKKRLLAAILSASMVLALAACGGGGGGAASSNPATSTPATSTPAASTPSTGGDETIYIPVMAKGFQHQFWQAVKAGAEAAATDLGVEIYFDGPASETEIDKQVNMVKTEMAKNPKAMALAALSTDAVKEILEECAAKGIPVIGFDSGVPDDTSGAVKATAATNNEAAAAIAAEKFGEHEGLVAKMQAATPDNPVVIGCISQDAVSASVMGRTTGFVNKMAEVAEKYQPGKVSVEGHTIWEKKVADPAIIIQVAISATTEATAVQTAATSLLGTKGLAAVFCSNEGAVTGFLAAVSDGEDLAEGGRYADLVVAGFDAGAAQKNAVRQGWFYGSVTQDPYSIGYNAVEMAYKAAKGEPVSDVDTGAQWYNADNIDDEMIALLVYD
ncbi:substrate-binding domain-containing protein [Flintibacter muris]|uniref:substrate-binding domain-containing protein n=1 Tax=Flintibacter muris TaxID=2941327 RepID=UPI002041B99F|nr:substrate-binding domain-containing protein [Flintibacter muris]